MSVPLVVNGVTYNFPQQFDKNWGPVVTAWATAVTTGLLQKAGGTFTLTADVNFGGVYGLIAAYFKSHGTNISHTGFLRLSNTDTLSWRNYGNSNDLALGVNSSDQLTFNGAPIGATTSLADGKILIGNVLNIPTAQTVSNDATLADTGALTIANGAITDVKVNASAAIALSKLATLTASSIVVTDGSGVLSTTVAPTLTELSYMSGVTSALQTQLGSITSALPNYLLLIGGTMSGDISMSSHKITSLTQGANNGEAIAFPITAAQISNGTITGTQIASSIALAGSPTTTTPPTLDSSNKIATTNWINPIGSFNLVANGYSTLPNGLIFQWGLSPIIPPGNSPQVIVFPIDFPSSVFNVQTTVRYTNESPNNATFAPTVGGVGTHQFTILNQDSDSSWNAYWFAIGK